jgi:hypothetical protein
MILKRDRNRRVTKFSERPLSSKIVRRQGRSDNLVTRWSRDGHATVMVTLQNNKKNYAGFII